MRPSSRSATVSGWEPGLSEPQTRVPVGAEDFRSALRRFPTGITVVTTVVEGQWKGFTANAFSSVSVDPPMILICVRRQSRTHPFIAEAGSFCVNILRLEQREVAVRFAARNLGDPFDGLSCRVGPTGSPILENALAYLDCTLAEEHTAGTHTIFVGAVVSCGFTDGAPLGYFNADYRDFGCRTP
jgi:flavin reductase (DIM6/NTAB) family NADH-FMN oxidoreductase RutF